MLNEEILKMAREAGMHSAKVLGVYGWDALTDIEQEDLRRLERFATLVVEKEPSTSGIIFAVEQSIRNGNCPWEIESAFDEYESDRQALHARSNTSNSIKE